jgi:hypothetical protein
MARRTEDELRGDRTTRAHDPVTDRPPMDRPPVDRAPVDRPPVDRPPRTERTVDITDRAPMVVEGNGHAIAALVTGLLAATFAFLIGTALAAVLFGIAAIVLGAKGLSKANTLGGLHKGLAVTGLVSGGLGLLLGLAIVIGAVTVAQDAQLQQQIQRQIEELMP